VINRLFVTKRRICTAVSFRQRGDCASRVAGRAAFESSFVHLSHRSDSRTLLTSGIIC